MNSTVYESRAHMHVAPSYLLLLRFSSSFFFFYLVVFCAFFLFLLFLHVLRFSWNLHTNCVWRWALYTGCTVAGREGSPKCIFRLGRGVREGSFIHVARSFMGTTHAHCHQRVKPPFYPPRPNPPYNHIWLLSILWASINNRNWY